MEIPWTLKTTFKGSNCMFFLFNRSRILFITEQIFSYDRSMTLTFMFFGGGSRFSTQNPLGERFSSEPLFFSNSELREGELCLEFLRPISKRKFQQTPKGTYPTQTLNQLFYEGNPFTFSFWGTWGMFQGSAGIFLDRTHTFQ